MPPIHMKVHPPHHHPQGVGAVTDGTGAPRGLATGVIDKLVETLVTKWKTKMENHQRDISPVVDVLLAPIANEIACRFHGDQAKKGRVMLTSTSSNNWATDEQRYKSTLTKKERESESGREPKGKRSNYKETK